MGFIVTNTTAGPEGVVRFYNGRGTAEQWIKEGKYALNWTRLSCRRFVANRVRLSLFVLAYNLGNFLRRLCLPKAVRHWSLRSVQVKLREGTTTILPRGRERSRESACLQCAFTPLAGDPKTMKTDKKHGSRQEPHLLSDRPEIEWPCRT